MPPFTYESTPNPYAASISDLLLRSGDIRANEAVNIARANAAATLGSGEAWARAGENIGQSAAGAIQRATDPRMQEYQQHKKDMAALDTAFTQPGGRDAIINALPGHLRPVVAKQFQESDELAARAQSAQISAENATGEYINGLADNIKFHQYDPNAAQLAVSHAKQTFATNPSMLQQVNQIERAIQSNPTPEAIQALVDPIIAARNAQKKKPPEPFSLRNGEVRFDENGNPIAAVPDRPTQPNEWSTALAAAYGDPAKAMELVKAQRGTTEVDVAMKAAENDPVKAMALLKPQPAPKPGTIEDWVAQARSLAATKKGSPLTAEETADSDAAAMSQFKQLSKDPEMAELAKSNAELRNLMLQTQLGQQPSKDDARVVAQQLVDHTMAPSQLSLFGGFGTAGQAFKRMVLLEAQKINPKFNLEDAESTYQLGKSVPTQVTVRYIDNIMQTLPRLEQASDDFKRSNVRLINKALLATKQQFGATDTTKFATDINILQDEIAKAFSGGGTGAVTSDAKLRQAQALLQGDFTPDQLRTTTNEVRELLNVRRGSLTRGTFMEKQSEPPPQSPRAPALGAIVTVKGQKLRVTKIGSDGQFEGIPVP